MEGGEIMTFLFGSILYSVGTIGLAWVLGSLR